MRQSSPRQIGGRHGREALLEAVLAELADEGPANIYPNDISLGLGLSKSLVNFHFGGRDGVIAEALVVGYERHIDAMWAVVEDAGSDPVDRLLAWIDAQFEWAVDNPGMVSAMSSPWAAASFSAIHTPDLAARLAVADQRNVDNLWSLVAAAHLHLRPKSRKGAADAARVGLDAGVIGWLTLGMSVFVAGRHLPTRNAAVRQYTELARQRMRETVLEMLRR